MLRRQLQKRALLSSRAKRGICFFLTLAALYCSQAQGQTPRPKILGISHVSIFVSDFCKSLPFYTSLNRKSAGCAPEDSHLKFGLGFVTPISFIHLDVASQFPGGNAVAEVGFWVSDVPAMREYLRSQGINVGDNASKSLHIFDPEGHRIAFMGPWSEDTSSPHQPVEPRIIHAGFIVRDRATMEHFYKDILGFRPYWHGGMKDDETTWVSLQVPDGTDWLELMLYDPAGKDKHFLGIMNHVALGVTDIHATQEQLRKNGAPLTEEPKIGRDGKWQLNLYDPDLTRVEFMEFTPKEKPCCSEFTAAHPKP